MKDTVVLYLIVWLGAGLRHVHESLQGPWCSVLRLSLGEVIEMRLLRIYLRGKSALNIILPAPPPSFKVLR